MYLIAKNVKNISRYKKNSDHKESTIFHNADKVIVIIYNVKKMAKNKICPAVGGLRIYTTLTHKVIGQFKK